MKVMMVMTVLLLAGCVTPTTEAQEDSPEVEDLQREQVALREDLEALEGRVEDLEEGVAQTVEEDDPEPAALEEVASEPAEEPASTQPPVVLSGEGEATTEPFDLAGGQYTVTYSYGGECFYGPSLGDPATGDALFQYALPSGGSAAEGESNLFGVEAGAYFLKVTTGPAPNCPWSFTFTHVP